MNIIRRNKFNQEVKDMYVEKLLISILPQAIQRFTEISIKILMVFITEVEQIILKSVGNHERPQIVKVILREKN